MEPSTQHYPPIPLMLSNGGAGLIVTASDKDSAFNSPSSSGNSSLLSSPKLGDQTSMNTICGICERTFIEPKVLPCLHTFCLACLEMYQVDKTMVKCVTCKAESNVPINGLAGLPPDYALVNFIDSKKGKLFCTSCRNTTATVALAKCLSCDCFLCHNCIMAHSYMKFFEGHKLVEIVTNICKEEENIPSILSNYTADCLLHKGESLRYFCQTCSIPICEVCTSMDHPHDKHRFEPIMKVGESLLAQTNKIAEDALSKGREIREMMENIQSTIWWLEIQHKESQKKINEAYEEYSSLLLKYKETQLISLDTEHSSLMTMLTSASKITEETCDRLSALRDFHGRLLKFASIPQTLVFKKYIDTKLKSFLTMNPKQITCHLMFVHNTAAIKSGIVSTFGAISSGMQINGVTVSHRLTQNDLQTFILSNEPIHRPPHRGDSHYTTAATFIAKQHFLSKYMKGKPMEELLSSVDYQQQQPIPECVLKSAGHLKSVVSRDTFMYTVKFGSQGSEEGKFSEPSGVAVNKEGDIIIADTNNNRVQVFDKNGRFKFKVGEGQLLYPNRVALLPKTEDIVVTERAPTHQIQIYSSKGEFIRKFGSDILQHPRAVAADHKGNIIVVECKVMRVLVFEQTGKLAQKFHCANAVQFPNSVAVNDKEEIFISDNRSHCVIVFDYQGNKLRKIGDEGVTNYPIGVVINHKNELMIADNHNNFNLTIFSQEGELLTALQSKTKHSQCFDVAATNENTVVLTCKDFHVYIYKYE